MLEAPLGTGSVHIQLPTRANISASLPGPDNGEDIEYDQARIWLTSGSTPVSLGEEGYIDVDDNSVTIDGLLPDSYEVRIAFGDISANGILYSVVAFGKSNTFEISAGVTSDVTVYLREQEVYTDENTIGVEYRNAVDVNGTLYVLSADGEIFEYQSGTQVKMDLTAITDPDVDAEIQSISLGGFFETESTLADELWINTDKGIFPYRDDAIVTDFSTAIPADGTLEINSTFVYLVEDPDTAEHSMVVATQGTGLDSLMGTFITYSTKDNPSSWSWEGWDSLDDVGGLSDIQDALSGVGEVVYDVVFKDNYVYAATALQALFFPIESEEDDYDLEGLIDYFSELEDPANDMDLETVLNYFYIVTLGGGAGDGKAIKTIEVEDPAPTAMRATLYLGTNTRNDRHNGVWAAEIDPATGAVEIDAEKIEETDGSNIKDILYSPAAGDGDGLSVAYTETSILVLDDGEFVKEIPAYAGLPGRVLDAEWNGSRLYVVGTEGVAYIDL